LYHSRAGAGCYDAPDGARHRHVVGHANASVTACKKILQAVNEEGKNSYGSGRLKLINTSVLGQFWQLRRSLWSAQACLRLHCKVMNSF